MKSGRKSKGGGLPFTLTRAERAARDRGEAARARGESRRARGEAEKAREEAASEREKALYHEAIAASDVRQDRPQRAAQEEAEAQQELASARGDLARAARDTARAGRDSARARRDSARARRAAAGLASPGVHGSWVLGGNDQRESCAAAAVANHLLLATGARLSDDEVMALHMAAAGSPDVPAPVWAVLASTAAVGTSAVERPSRCRARLSHGRISENTPLIVELDLELAQRDQAVWDAEPSPPWGRHAALLAGGHLVSWGREIPVTRAFLERQVTAAWAVEWAGRSVWRTTTLT